jgi:hypothetical protein
MNYRLYKTKWNKIKIKTHNIKKTRNKNTQICILVQHNYASMFVWLHSQKQEICKQHKQHNATTMWTCSVNDEMVCRWVELLWVELKNNNTIYTKKIHGIE